MYVSNLLTLKFTLKTLILGERDWEGNGEGATHRWFAGCSWVSGRPVSPCPTSWLGDGGSTRWNINGVRFCVRYNMAYSWYQASWWENGVGEKHGMQSIPCANWEGIQQRSVRRHSRSIMGKWIYPVSCTAWKLSMVPCWEIIYFHCPSKWKVSVTNWLLNSGDKSWCHSADPDNIKIGLIVSYEVTYTQVYTYNVDRN